MQDAIFCAWSIIVLLCTEHHIVLLLRSVYASLNTLSMPDRYRPDHNASILVCMDLFVGSGGKIDPQEESNNEF